MTPRTSGVRLEAVLPHMSRGQLLRLAARLGPKPQSNITQDVLRVHLERLLRDERALDAFAASLTATERALLGEVRRAGGRANGWALLTFARLRGLAPPAASPLRELYRSFQPLGFEDTAFLTVPLSDGLLLPATLPSDFLTSGYGGPTGDALPPEAADVFADARLLARVAPDAPPPLAWRPTRAPFEATSGIAALLRVVEVTRALALAGGVPFTRAGDVNRTAVKRLARSVPAVDDVELWLDVAAVLGAAAPDEQGGVLVAARAGLLALLNAPPAERRALLARAARATSVADHAAQLARPRAARAALLHLVEAPPHPVRESELLDAFARFAPPAVLEPGWRAQVGKKAPVVWARAELRGPLRDLGLVDLGPGDDPSVAATTNGEATDGPAWVLQPNFELLVYPHALRAEQLRILGAAQAVRFDASSATYRLTRDSVYGALEGGLTLDALLTGLEGASATPLAPNVRATLADWAARRERLTLHRRVTLLEYPDANARDAAIAAAGLTPVGDTFALAPRSAPLPPGARVVTYDAPPERTLRFLPDGRVRATGVPDLFARRALEEHATRDGNTYTLRPGALPASFVRDLEARAANAMPDALRALLTVWSGAAPPPALADLAVLQHPQAAALAKHPRLAPLLGPALSPTLIAVPRERRAELERELVALGLEPASELTDAPDAGAAAPAPFTDTRKKREFIEEAIRAGRRLLVLYQDERRVGWGGTPSPGRKRQEELAPLAIQRQGSTPYLEARHVDTGEDRWVRVGYILAMALR